MKRILAAALLIASLGSAMAQPPEKGPPCGSHDFSDPLRLCEVMYPQKIIPPKEYDRPYAGKLEIVTTDLEKMKTLCPNTRGPMACTWLYSDRCVIYITSDDIVRKRRLTPEMVLRHEMGHCNGWGPDHAGARTLTQAVARRSIFFDP